LDRSSISLFPVQSLPGLFSTAPFPVSLLIPQGFPLSRRIEMPITCHTAGRGSGRVSRSAAGRSLEEQALDLAVAAWIRHQWTDYDELLSSSHERFDARELMRHKIGEVIDRWKRI
jgi:hypothetical protein